MQKIHFVCCEIGVSLNLIDILCSVLVDLFSTFTTFVYLFFHDEIVITKHRQVFGLNHTLLKADWDNYKPRKVLWKFNKY